MTTTNVDPAEYKRLLGYPCDRVLDDRARELADNARAWYARHGRPWVYARQAQELRITNCSIVIDDVPKTLVMRLGKKTAVLINRNPPKQQTVWIAEC